jgi:hypothetical protein
VLHPLDRLFQGMAGLTAAEVKGLEEGYAPLP